MLDCRDCNNPIDVHHRDKAYSWLNLTHAHQATVYLLKPTLFAFCRRIVSCLNLISDGLVALRANLGCEATPVHCGLYFTLCQLLHIMLILKVRSTESYWLVPQRTDYYSLTTTYLAVIFVKWWPHEAISACSLSIVASDFFVDVSDATSVPRAMEAYITNFFSCMECRKNYVKELKKYPYKGHVFTHKDAVLWMWDLHNEVNRRWCAAFALKKTALNCIDVTKPWITFVISLKCRSILSWKKLHGAHDKAKLSSVLR